MARMKIDLKPNLSAAAKQPLYAGIGATDLAVTAVREYAADLQDRVFAVQKDVTSTVSDVQKQVTGFSPKKVVNDSVEAVEARVAEIQAEAKALPGKVQSTIDENVNTVVATYGDLARRGEAIVRGTKLPTSVEVDVDVDVATTKPTPGQKSAKKTTGITRRTEAVVKPVDTAKTADKKASAASKSTASRSTSKSTTSRTTASKTTAPKSTTSKTTTAKKAPASKSTASKSTTSTTAKKAPASKSTTSSTSTSSS